MFSRRRTVVALALLLSLAGGVLLSRGAGVTVQAAPSVTVDGAALTQGAREVSPRAALGLLLPPGSHPVDFRAALDGRQVVVAEGSGRTARLDVGEFAQGTRHRLEVWRVASGPTRGGTVTLDFQVTEPLRLAAAWLVSPAQVTVQVSSSRELADQASVSQALTRAGAVVRRDDRGIEGRWPSGRGGATTFTVAAGLRATSGAYLPADFTASLGEAGTAPSSRVDLSGTEPPLPTGLSLQAYYLASQASRVDLGRHARQITVLSPAFYAATAAGTLVTSVDEQALTIARTAGLEVMPLVTNQDFSATAARGLFASAGAADALTAALVTEAQGRGYAGYQLDFEGLAVGDRDALTGFSQRLGERLKDAHLKYSTAVIPRKQPRAGGLEQLFSHAGVYNYGALARDATSMSLMAYDQHTSASDAGPVAGVDWVQQVVEASTVGLDRSRVYLGVPLYYRDWPLRGNPTAGGYEEALSTAAAHDGTVAWDFAAQSPYIRYSTPGDEHVVWLENRASLVAKARVARAMGFAGLAAWRLGLEDPGFWDLWPSR